MVCSAMAWTFVLLVPVGYMACLGTLGQTASSMGKGGGGRRLSSCQCYRHLELFICCVHGAGNVVE